VNDVNEDSISKYKQFRKFIDTFFLTDHAPLNRMLNMLRSLNVLEPAAQILLDELSQIVYDFEQYLLQNHGLCKTSAIRHRTSLRQFLHQYCSLGVSSFSSLRGKTT
jgi:hypothetical protein